MSTPLRWWPTAVIALTALLSGFCVRAASAVFFTGPDLVPSSGGPGGLALAEMTRDGALDLVVTGTRDGMIFIHRGRGDGTYRTPTPLIVGGSPGPIDVADMDHNGLTDVVWVDEVSGGVGILFQRGSNPVIYVPELYRGEDEPKSLVVVDVDGDTWDDVVVANHGADLVSVYHNQGGVLRPPERHDVGDGPSVLEEVWWPTRQERRFVVVQRGALADNVGVYTDHLEPLQLLSVVQPRGASALDWNADPYPDLALISTTGRGHLYTGQPSGQFTSAVSWEVAPGASQVQAMGEIDGENGLLVLESSKNRVTVYSGPTAGPVRPRKGYFLGVDVERFYWGDTDLDGTEEVLVPLPEEDNILIMRRQGSELTGFVSTLSGGIPRQLGVTSSSGGLPQRLAALCPGSGEIWVYDLIGGELVPSNVLAVVPTSSRRFRWGRINGDDLADLVVMDEATGATIFLAQGTGFAAPIAAPAAGSFRDVALARWGAGTELDLVLADASLQKLRIFEGDGSGGFIETGAVDCEDVPRRVSAIDLDLDGRDDLVSVSDGGTLCLSYGNSQGLDEQSIFNVGQEPRCLAFNDFNADGLPDIAVGNAGDGTFSVLASVIPRLYGFSTQEQITPDGAQSVITLDVNQDQNQDVVFCSPASSSISIHLNAGGGVFVLPVRVRCSSLPFDMAAADINDDGVTDIVVADTLGDALVSLIAESAGAAAGEESEGGSDPSPAPELTGSDATLWLAPPYPNPSRGSFRLRFRSPYPQSPVVHIYDLRGRRVRDVTIQSAGVGWYDAEWDGRDAEGRAVARGRYLVELKAGSERRTRSLVLR